MATHNSARSGSRRANLWTSCKCQKAKLNSLWSIWYCVVILSFEIYLIASSIRGFSFYVDLPWPPESQPFMELNTYVTFVAVAVVLLPFFVICAVLKVSNWSNDGYKLGGLVKDRQMLFGGRNECRGGGAAATNSDTKDNNDGEFCKSLLAMLVSMWRHSGPIAAFLHIISAFCLLFPKVLIQGKLIKHGFQHKDEIWRTDLDFMIPHRDRIVVLSFLSASNYSGGNAVSSSEIFDSNGARRSANSVPVGLAANNGHQFDELIFPVSPEFVNYAIALLVYSVRYPAVFWDTNKPFSFLFSLQLILSSLHSLLAFTGFAVLYKLNTYGVEYVLPANDELLLNRPAAVMLYLLSSIISTISGSIVYFYGLRKYQAYMRREHERHHISWRETSRTLWGYLPHCMALAVLVAMAISTCPLMYDYTVVYKGSLDGAILASVVGVVLYFFLWIVLWFVLTLKQRWQFQVAAVGSAACNAKSSRLMHTDMELLQKHNKNVPMIILNAGQIYAIRELIPRKAIMSVVHKNAQFRRRHKNLISSDDDDDIYWLKPKPEYPKESPEAETLLLSSNRRASPSNTKHKVVTFDESLTVNSPRQNRKGKFSKACSKFKKQNLKLDDLTDTDEDGDYATLRDIPLIQEEEEHDSSIEDLLKATLSDLEEGRMNDDDEGSDKDECSATNDENDYFDEHSRRSFGSRSPVHRVCIGVTVHDETPSPQARAISELLALKTPVEKHSEIGTGRSNSLSSSSSPQEKCNSDTSSGIHSSSSICDNSSSRKSCSVDDLPVIMDIRARMSSPKNSRWKSHSLQKSDSHLTGRTMLSRYPHQRQGGCRIESQSDEEERMSDSSVIAIRSPKLDHHQVRDTPEPFGRTTNMRLMSFSDQSRDAEPLTPSAVGSCNKDKWPPMTIAVLNSSPRHLRLVHDSNCPRAGVPVNPEISAIFKAGQHRDSANFSLTSSAGSDSNLTNV